MLKLYDSRLSGNSWKVRILLTQLEIPFERITLDLSSGATKDPAFLSKSKFARVPVAEFENGRTIVESAAILLHIAEGTHLLAKNRFLRAEVIGWITFEQADLLKPLALCRIYHLRGLAERMAQRIADLQESGYPALSKLDAWLIDREWLVGGQYGVADIAVYPYVSMASLGGYDMASFGAIAAWIARVEAQPGWVPLMEEA
jgi:glutathione S-transferase